MPLASILMSVVLLVPAMACGAVGGKGDPAVPAVPGDPGDRALVWEAREVTVHVPEDAAEARARFVFRNDGPSTIRITEVRGSCRCTATAAELRAYGPGESGAIEARLVLGGKRGIVRETLLVHSDSAGEPVVLLTAVAHVPDPIQAAGDLVFWRRGEEQTPRLVELKAVDVSWFRVASIDAGDSGMSVQIDEVEAGKHYRVSVVPGSRTRPGRHALTIRTVDDAGGERQLPLHVQVPTGLRPRGSAQPLEDKR